MNGKRIILSLILVSNAAIGILPGIACLSGAQQEGIANAFFTTGTDIVRRNVETIIPVANTGNAAFDNLWNNGAAWVLDLLQLTVETIGARYIDFAIPDDPFPGP